MRSVDNQSFQQDSGDLLLDCFLICFGKKVEEGARKVLRVAVRIAQLIGDAVEEQVTSLGLQVYG